MNIWRIALQVLRQNRWLLILLGLWPCAISAILLIPKGRVETGDIQALLQQEAIYGVALAAFQAGSLLRNEQRSRRIIQILACPVSRGEYLFALLLATVLPLVLYLGGFIFSGFLLTDSANLPMDGVYLLAAIIFELGIWVACAALLFSVFLPSLLASAGSLLLLGALFWVGISPAQLVIAVASMPASEKIKLGIIQAQDIGIAIGEMVLLFGLSWILFSRRDLNLTSE